MNIPDNEMINVSYTNWRGEAKVRRVLLGRVRFGSTDWHKEPTWLINAFDLDHPYQVHTALCGDIREQGIRLTRQPQPIKPQVRQQI